MWAAGARDTELTILAGSTSDADLADQSIFTRARLGDTSVVPQLITRYRTQPAYWGQVIRHVWSKDLQEETERLLDQETSRMVPSYDAGNSNTMHDMARLMVKIPLTDAEKLMEKYWPYFRYSVTMIQTALYLGSKRTKRLADEAIRAAPSEVNVFRFLTMTYGFAEPGRRELLSIRHLEDLLPYLDRLTAEDAEDLCDGCQRIGQPDWGKKNLSTRISADWHKNYYPTNADLQDELEGFASDRHGSLRTSAWLERLPSRIVSVDRVLTITDDWLNSAPSYERLVIAAVVVGQLGIRHHAVLLTKHEWQEEKAQRVINSSQFRVKRRTLEY